MSEVKNCGMTVAEAFDCLTLGEVESIEAHFGPGVGTENYSGFKTSAGLVWAYERRNDLKNNAKTLTNWKDISGWTVKQLNAYFVNEEVEVDEANPETDQGKDA